MALRDDIDELDDALYDWATQTHWKGRRKAPIATLTTNPLTGMLEILDPETELPLITAGHPENTIAIVGNSIVAQCVPLCGTTTTRWVPATAKTVSNAIIPVSYRGVLRSLKYVCTVAGTTGADYTVEPEWPTVVGGTVTDGSVTWEAQADGDIVASAGGNWWFWSQALSEFRLSEVYMAGLSGKKMAEIAQLTDALIATHPRYAMLASVFSNDIWAAGAGTVQNISAAYVLWETMLEQLIGSGIKPIITTELPNGNIDSNGSAFTDYQSSRGGTKNWYWLNEKIRTYARANVGRILFFDMANIYRNTNPANPVWPDNATTYTTNAGGTQKVTDGIHPTGAGAFLIAQKLAPFIAANFPTVDHFGNGAGSTYDEDPNPSNYGTTGTDGTGSSGDVAVSLTSVAYGTGGAITSSKVARTDVAGSWQRQVYTATNGDNADLNWSKIAASVGVVAGDVVQAIGEIKIAASPTAFSRPEIRVRYQGTANPQWVYAGYTASTDAEIGQFLTADTTFTIATPPFVVPSGFTYEYIFSKANARAVVSSFTVDHGRRTLRRVTVPALA